MPARATDNDTCFTRTWLQQRTQRRQCKSQLAVYVNGVNGFDAHALSDKRTGVRVRRAVTHVGCLTREPPTRCSQRSTSCARAALSAGARGLSRVRSRTTEGPQPEAQHAAERIASQQACQLLVGCGHPPAAKHSRQKLQGSGKGRGRQRGSLRRRRRAGTSCNRGRSHLKSPSSRSCSTRASPAWHACATP